jgi:hypothetical protein
MQPSSKFLALAWTGECDVEDLQSWGWELHEQEMQRFWVHVCPLEFAKMLEQNGRERSGAVGVPSRIVLPAAQGLRACIERKREHGPSAQKSESLDAWRASQKTREVQQAQEFEAS